MIPIRKPVNVSNNIAFRIPAAWRNEMNLSKGSIVKIRIQNDSIIIKASNQYTTEVTSTVGDSGQIYIPTEVRNHFQLKGIENFKIFIEEKNKNIILKPFN
ncbi:hypothetical protein J18TS1_24600 [Oceanobacillus oncorhynchi subsp. incaldanensis]|uniref:AbrB/MazE/SpoVT family DNA-binding domain-containing protein n=1 Tax=Oceanobacillus oncorhynchi TaxID=545501 RepID=UPI001B196BCC|nr:AbrB/MazE/SpoVT family DNA-binding domain-containing protein [Oceanobacillus oncorhynchi]GIO19360.1 hypothetical protein J18TS1_24600 [Oceanobacillus oncorhynchi subsp. incaldanensis]